MRKRHGFGISRLCVRIIRKITGNSKFQNPNFKSNPNDLMAEFLNFGIHLTFEP